MIRFARCRYLFASFATVVCITSVWGLLLPSSIAAPKPTKTTTVVPDPGLLKMVRKRAINFLRTSQSDDGSWTSPTAPGITALAATALSKSGLPPTDSTLARSLDHLQTFIQKDGGIYFKKSNHRNYETCIALLAFQTTNRHGKHDTIIKEAENFLRNLQWDEGEGLKSSDAAFGGAGYGIHQRPDLSNTQFLLEAFKAAGVKSDDPAMKNALCFVSRCQNLESEHNITPLG